MNSADPRRRRQLNALTERVNARWPAQSAPLIGDFLQHYYAAVASEDLSQADINNLYGAALSHWAWGDERAAGATAIHAYNPDPEQNGWESTHSVVQIVTDDRPFLVDSLSMAINAHGLMIHRIIHPVLEVERDERHRITAVGDQSADSGQPEAWIHLEVDRQSNATQLKALKAAIADALNDVEAAVADWQPMCEQAQAALEGLRAHPPNIDSAERDEVEAFIEWLLDDHFTFLGYRFYTLNRHNDEIEVKRERNSGLGLLRNANQPSQASTSFEALPEGLREQALEPDPLVLTKSSHRSSVHRRGYMDSIGIKCFNAAGEVTGEHRFLGLFTSAAYSRNPRGIPLLRRKLEAVLKRAGLRQNSHAGKALAHILETYPRDELFQTDVDTLYHNALGILHLQERQQVRLFLRHDRYGRFVSCLIYAPRDRYDTAVRKRMQAILLDAFDGAHSEFTVQLSEAVLARIHFVIHFGENADRSVDQATLEAQLAATTRSWSDELGEALLEHSGEAAGTRLFQTYGQAFNAAYREDTSARSAAQDIERLESLDAHNGLVISLYRPLEAPAGALRLKLYHRGEPITLSAVLPVLEHMGVQVVDERPYAIYPEKSEPCWIHDFGLAHDPALELDAGQLREHFQSAFAAIWRGEADDDGFNRLILMAGLSWRDIVILRAYAQYLRQAGTTYSQPYIEDSLSANPEIAAGLVALFEARLHPERANAETATQCTQTIETQLDAVASLDEDRILRRLLAAINATLRTNYYRTDNAEQASAVLSLKLKPEGIPGVPKPVPAYEIFVSSPRVEGVHLRGGKVARGGLRWSDRREDYRTEILGLMKAQMVKNALIVPVGAKGGFVCKRLPRARAEQPAEVLECYRQFIRALLDVTDNIVDGTVTPPPRVIRHDDDDPYLVVAADKGTATFSDEANAIAEAYHFWLHDAFASGGSTGYDHKKMGITARGAWVAVQRHFREQGRDIQSESFTAVGIGDMSGDVFGNGMLQSRSTHLIAAFDHRHIFIDPNPDAERSYAERERLFALERSSWADYDESLISEGGGVWPRSAKSIRLSAAARNALGVDAERLTPLELISAILCAPVDLLWNGGIGTYIKAGEESHADVGDKSNDGLRVNAQQLRCSVIGEGGNLGVTALGRIAFALRGGYVNSDAIDNSGGVDCSDHEVNIKILLNGVVDDGDITTKQRNALLARMTDAVADHVLANNYRQTQGLSLMVERAAKQLPEQARCMRALERDDQLDRGVEQLPDDETLNERQQQGLGLTRPELSILLAYTKIRSYEQLLASDLVDGEENLADLNHYFPAPLSKRFAKRIDQHPLRREIIATNLANHILNRMGATFLMRMTETTGASLAEAARAFLAARELFGLRERWHQIDALDNQITSAHQYRLLDALCHTQERATVWLLRRRSSSDDPAAAFKRRQKAIERFQADVSAWLTQADHARLVADYEAHCEAGVPEALARQVSELPALYTALDISEAALQCDTDLALTAEVHARAAEALSLDRLREALNHFVPGSDWQARYRDGLLETLDDQHRRLTESILNHGPERSPADRLSAWMEQHGQSSDPFQQTTDQVCAAAQPDPAMLGVAIQQLQQLTGTPAAEISA